VVGFEGFFDLIKEWWGKAQVTGFASFIVAKKKKKHFKLSKRSLRSGIGMFLETSIDSKVQPHGN